METEGVIKFDLHLREGPPPQSGLLTELLAWRMVLFRLGFTGRDPERYGGLAYGNVSVRISNGSFLISGTQTGAEEFLSPAHFCLIEGFDLPLNRVDAKGTIAPSSESLTHAAIYQANLHCRSVLHVHSPSVWHRFKRMRLPATAETIPYGTPAMAFAVGDLVRRQAAGTIAMLGHEDGILSFGPSPEKAAISLLRHYAESFYSYTQDQQA